MRVAVKFAYDGTKFHGYARQPNVKTVEEELLTILLQHNIITDAKTACVRTASRTDKGVSALGNVIAFNTDTWNETVFQDLTEKREDIIIYGFVQVEPDFYPRYAQQRNYRYYLKKESLDKEKIFETAALFTGEHNFRNFARVEPLKNPLRCIDMILFSEDDDFFIIDFYAETFLWHQIRRIISGLEKVACGKLSKKQVNDALDNPEKKVDFGLAPPEPLLLKDVVYGFEFDLEKNALKKIHQLERRIVSSLR